MCLAVPAQLIAVNDAIGTVDNHLELLLADPVGWQEEIEAVHLEILQEKMNNYIHFLESKQYVERYGDSFDKKVIHITFQYSPSDNGLAFLTAVQKTLQNTDMSLKVELPEWQRERKRSFLCYNRHRMYRRKRWRKINAYFGLLVWC